MKKILCLKILLKNPDNYSGIDFIFNFWLTIPFQNKGGGIAGNGFRTNLELPTWKNKIAQLWGVRPKLGTAALDSNQYWIKHMKDLKIKTTLIFSQHISIWYHK